jgi:exonuclease SbcD
VIRASGPCIAYSGNTQGRHINETGAKGCYLVAVEDGEIVSREFRPTDVLRWHRVDVPLAEEDELDALYAAVREHLEKCRAGDDDRFTAARLTVTGACAAHGQLVDATVREQAVAEIQNIANDLGDMWLERIDFATSPPVDLAQLRHGGDLLGELLRHIDHLRQHPDEQHEFTEILQPLVNKVGTGTGLISNEADIRARLPEWLDQAERLLVARIAGQ